MLPGGQGRPAGLVPQGDLVGHGVRAGVVAGPLERFGQGWVGRDFTGDALGVEGVGPALPAPAGLLGGAGRAHISDVVAGLGQEHRRVPSEGAGPLDASRHDRPEAVGPGVH